MVLTVQSAFKVTSISLYLLFQGLIKEHNYAMSEHFEVSLCLSTFNSIKVDLDIIKHDKVICNYTIGLVFISFLHILEWSHLTNCMYVHICVCNHYIIIIFHKYIIYICIIMLKLKDVKNSVKLFNTTVAHGNFRWTVRSNKVSVQWIFSLQSE